MDNKMTALNGMDLSMVNGGEMPGEIHGMEAMGQAKIVRKLKELPNEFDALADLIKKILGY